MSAANRRRGADAERAVVAWLRAHGWPDARRYLAGDGRQPGDIDAWPGICIEVKDRAESNWPTWVAQARDEAGPQRCPIVVRRLRGTPDVGQWPTVLPMSWWFRLGGTHPLPVITAALARPEKWLQTHPGGVLWQATDGSTHAVVRFAQVADLVAGDCTPTPDTPSTTGAAS